MFGLGKVYFYFHFFTRYYSIFQNVFALLPSLVKLNLSNNQITSIAGDIGLMQNLVHLSLSNNKIKDLPRGMSKLKQLKYLSLTNNPLRPGLAEAIGPSQNNSQRHKAAMKAVEYFQKKQGKCFRYISPLK